MFCYLWSRNFFLEFDLFYLGLEKRNFSPAIREEVMPKETSGKIMEKRAKI